MKTTVISVTAFVFLIINAFIQQPNYTQLKAEAEAQYAQGSYSRANETYTRVDKTKLSTSDRRWVEFRLADTLWRSQAATQTADTTKFDVARKQLEELIRVVEKEEDRDLVWTEAHESLGDFFWTRRGNMDWGSGWPHYQQALDWWAGQRDLDRARARYLKMVFKAAHPINDGYYYYTCYGVYIPMDVLENALKISNTANDQSHLHFLIGMTMRYTAGDYASRQRVPDEFDDALSGGRQTDWYDDALFHYAEWMNNNGSIRQLEDGQWQQQPDYVKALELYRRLTREFGKGETQYFDQAQQQIKNITEATVSVGVSNIFLPGSEIQFNMNARNVRRVDFAIYKFDMTRDIRFSRTGDDDEGDVETETWIQKLPIAGRQPVKAWSRPIDENGSHQQHNAEVLVAGQLPPGAYLLEAKGGSLTARDIILVSDATLVIKSAPKQALAFFVDAVTGKPIANANIALWESYYRNNSWHWRRLRQTTNADGLAHFTLNRSDSSNQLFAAAAINDRQAFAASYSYMQPGQEDSWRIYAFTDRPAYRPKETMQWKFIARRRGAGATALVRPRRRARARHARRRPAAGAFRRAHARSRGARRRRASRPRRDPSDDARRSPLEDHDSRRRPPARRGTDSDADRVGGQRAPGGAPSRRRPAHRSARRRASRPGARTRGAGRARRPRLHRPR